jgi:hypothetical protein
MKTIYKVFVWDSEYLSLDPSELGIFTSKKKAVAAISAAFGPVTETSEGEYEPNEVIDGTRYSVIPETLDPDLGNPELGIPVGKVARFAMSALENLVGGVA